jgi:hypothetical protein
MPRIPLGTIIWRKSMGRLIGLLLAVVAGIGLNADAEQGRYFAKKHYEPHPLPAKNLRRNTLHP